MSGRTSFPLCRRPASRSLARRLSGLEHKLEDLDEGTKEVLRQSAGSWLGALGEAVDGVVTPIEEEQAAGGAAGAAAANGGAAAAAGPRQEGGGK